MITSIIKEMELRSGITKREENEPALLSPENDLIETVYFGGGTPSLLSSPEINRLLESLKNNYRVSRDAEITLEANPDDITIDALKEWKNVGINRLSIGIQSFIERDLVWMNRAHNARQALQSIDLATTAGFTNFSIDLIFGIPNLSDEEWDENIEKVIRSAVPHVACYALTVEPETALHKMIALKKKQDVNTDVQARQYKILMQRMYDAGYEHYEISNFALPGFRSRHNSSYWQGKRYIGIGPSAHSYDGLMRLWNKPNNALYIKSIKENIIPFEKEILTKSQQLNEYIMTSLRTIEGMDLFFIETHFTAAERRRIENVFRNEVEKKLFINREGRMILTDEGKLFADGIAVKLFL